MFVFLSQSEASTYEAVNPIVHNPFTCLLIYSPLFELSLCWCLFPSTVLCTQGKPDTSINMFLCWSAAAGVFVHTVYHLAVLSDTRHNPPPATLPSLCYGSSTLSQTANMITPTAGDTAAVNLKGFFFLALMIVSILGLVVKHLIAFWQVALSWKISLTPKT